MQVQESITRFGAKILFASLLPMGLLIGSVYFVVDTSLRGLEKSIDITNERLTDVLDEIGKVRDDVNSLKVAVAQLDIATTSKLDGILKSLEKITYIPEDIPNFEYQISVGARPFSVDTLTGINSATLIRGTSIYTSADFEPEIVAAAIQDRFVSFGSVSATLACREANPNDCGAVASDNSNEEVDAATGLSVFAGDWQVLRSSLAHHSQSAVPFALPVNAPFRITAGFGFRRDPKSEAPPRLHAGTDLAAAYGTPILATADGVVTFAGWEGGYGRRIVIRHQFGIETTYSHLSEIRVKVGQKVKQGDTIGDMGNSGRSTATHLHYEVKIDGKPVNPMTFIKAASTDAAREVVSELVAQQETGVPSTRPRPRPN